MPVVVPDQNQTLLPQLLVAIQLLLRGGRGCLQTVSTAIEACCNVVKASTGMQESEGADRN